MRVGTILRSAAVALTGVLAMGAGDVGWLSLCSKCLDPSITATSGLGTAKAVAEARISREDIKGWCENWSPEDHGCVARELANPGNKGAFKATADCTAGRIHTILGEDFTYAGLWDNSDIGGGRSKWRDKSGQIVGRDNASNGLAISQQWEVLCPRGLVRGASAAPVASVAGAAYAVGQTVEAKYMSGWVRGRIVSLRRGASGVDYEVLLANGQRGIVPARMLRPAQ
jgi:hypothetical protein